jgi:hypothetical protein
MLQYAELHGPDVRNSHYSQYQFIALEAIFNRPHLERNPIKNICPEHQSTIEPNHPVENGRILQ